ncbi:MAG: fructose bisphosphate aldolase [Gemmatimonadota bacterium]
MLHKVQSADGFLAALDQSGGSTPKALGMYGVPESSYSGNQEMFDRVHEMRTRIVTSASFDGDRILGAILFEDTMGREVAGKPTARYLWEEKRVVPFLKVDKGLAAEENGVQLMNPMPQLDELLERALDNQVFGTKMRSVIASANETGIQAIVDQQFEIGGHILSRGLIPILEPEVDIHSPSKADCEEMLRTSILAHLDALEDGRQVMLKLTLPDQDDFYAPCIEHPNTLRVVALSGGYSRDQANQLLARNPGLIASFSRALTEGLTVQQSDEEFDALLDSAIQSIFEASRT